MRIPGSFVSQITVVLAPILMLGGCAQLGDGQIESGNGGSSTTSSSGAGGSGSSSGTGSGGSGSSTGTGGGSSGSSGGTGGTGSSGTTGSGGSSGSAVASDLPCDVANLLSSKCLTCHGARPAGGAPMSLTNYAQMTAPAITDPTKTMAVVAVSRMMNTTAPMPPIGYPQATSAEITALQNWISAGYPMTGCSTVTTPADAGTPPPDPFSVAPTCTSGKTWTGGTDGSGSMQPGVACISCHKSSGGEAPQFTIAGTVYPTAHEPNQCNGVNGSTDGAQVVITDANKKTLTLTPNSAGNFYSTAAVALPFTAKVTYMGRERDMVGSQTSGDCNACHTQNGTTTTTSGSPAPGRIILP